MIPGVSPFRLLVAAAAAAALGHDRKPRSIMQGDAVRNVRAGFHPFSNPPYGIRKMQRAARKRRNQLRNKKALRRCRV